MGIYILESYSGYQHYEDELRDSQCFTTSPGLYEALRGRGVRIDNLETLVSGEKFDQLARAGYDFTFDLCDLLNEVCTWRGNADLRLALAFGVNNCFFPIFYKSLLVQMLVDSHEGMPVYCIGDPGSTVGKGLRLLYGRFENLFALLASISMQGMVRLLPHKDDTEALTRREQAILSRRMSSWEKGLSLLNNTSSSFLAKSMRSLRRKHFAFLPHFLLRRAQTKRHVYIYNDCEMIDEILLGLLVRGVSVDRMERLPVCGETSEDAVEGEEITREHIHDLLVKRIQGRGLEFVKTFEAGAEVVCARIIRALTNLKAGLPALRAGFDRILARMDPNGIILTNALTSPEERLFYCHCLERGCKVVAFEHGLVYGLSEWDSWCARHAGMLPADVGVYHTRAAADCVGFYAPEQEKIVVGLPRTTYRPVLPSLQRRVARKWLGLRQYDHVVMYLAGLERNNYVYGPCMENDLLQHRRVYDVTHVLRKRFPSSKIIVKLYPSTRYADQHDYADLADLEGVLVIRDMDFRFIRCAADMIFVHSAQSTLGWCLGSDATVVYLEPAQAPVKFDGAPINCPDIPGLKAAKVIEMRQFAERAEYDQTFFASILA